MQDDTLFTSRLPYSVAPTNVHGAFSSSAPVGTPSGWRAEDYIAPQLQPQFGRIRILTPSTHTDQGYTNSEWAGSVMPGQWSSAEGTWVIPTVGQPTQPQGLTGGWDSSSWVGIDGFNIAGLVSNDVLQAGIQQVVDSGGNALYVAWFEWFAPAQQNSPDYINQTNIPNFPVSPGQTIYCAVKYVSKTAGYLFLGNVTTGQHTNVTLAPPPGATFAGNWIEWIMEAPGYGYPNTALPAFTPVVFTEASGTSSDGQTIGNPANGVYVNIIGDGQTMTSVDLADHTVTIKYTRGFPHWGGTIPGLPGWPFTGTYLIADLDGDRAAEVAYLAPDSRWYITCGNGDSYKGIPWGTSIPPGWSYLGSHYCAADLDGDGAAEIIYLAPDAHWYIIRGRDGSQYTGIPWGTALPPDWPANYFSFFVADLDGDGAAEIIYLTPDARWNIIRGRDGGQYTGIPWGTALPPGWPADQRQYFVADLDGDGAAEIAYIAPDARWYIIRGRDGGQYTGIPWGTALPPGWPADRLQYLVADLDGDGAAEIAHIAPDGRWNIICGRDGSQYTGIRWGTALPPGWPANLMLSPVVSLFYFLADFDGDGAADIAYRPSDGAYYIIRGRDGKQLAP